MTRPAALLLLAVLLAVVATPRPAAPVIPATTGSGVGEPDQERQTEAPHNGLGMPDRPGGASPLPTLAAVATDVPATNGQPPPDVSVSAITGIASWFCLPGRSPCTAGYPASGAYAAAGPALRVGAWRGRTVTVNGLPVRLIDWCACPGGRLIDLYASVMRQLAPLSAGLVKVEVTW